MQHVGEVSARGGWGYQEVTYYRYDTGTYPVLVGDIATAATLRVERHDYATEAAIEPLSLASAVMPAQPQLDTRSRRRLRSRDGDFYSNGLSDW
ncbi:MAG: hypothetical protein KIH63_004535 [Candidatus Saccharibacteria bacterium]|nr:hypothetical protein [Candidatus Saccharibacteria bacterium]